MEQAVEAGCVERKLRTEYLIGHSVIYATMLLTFLAIGLLNVKRIQKKFGVKPILTWKRRWALLFLTIPVGVYALELAWQSIDYNDLRYLLKEEEDMWSYAQKVQVGLVFAGVFLAFWVGLEVDCEFTHNP
jgi:ABC-type uncharacterized transport system YnjBCD permease subunit